MGRGDGLWEGACWAFVFLWRGVADAAEWVCHDASRDRSYPEDSDCATMYQIPGLIKCNEMCREIQFGMTITSPQKNQGPRTIPKRQNSAAKFMGSSFPNTVHPHQQLQDMSFATPLRRQPLRALNNWTCASCSRSLARLPRAENRTFTPARRWLNTTKETRQSHVPRMDQMHARYKEKNRTVMYAAPVTQPRQHAHIEKGTTSSAS
jgi:hypothetical protein